MEGGLSSASNSGGQGPAANACTERYESLRELKPLGIVFTVGQLPIWRARARGQCVHGAMCFITALTRSVSPLLCVKFQFSGLFGKCVVIQL